MGTGHEAMKDWRRNYAKKDPSVERDELVATWKKAFPEAAAERSEAFHPLVCVFKTSPPKPDPPVKEADEQWTSDVYFVSVRRWRKDPVFGTDEGMIQLGIAALDGTARHDWRDFQQIKNQLAGPECEAFELYPAESRKLDPSNYYTLWCFPGIHRLKIGVNQREIRDADTAWAAQRALAPGESTC